VHLLGNDSTLEPQAISKIVAELEANPAAGAATPLLLFTGDEPLVQFYRATINRELVLHQHYHVTEPYVRGQWPTIESEFIPCVALCFRAKALREVGLFDEVFGTCWEDFDLCLRFHDKGWKYLTVGDATAVHFGSFTTGRESPYITYYTTRNRLICLHRYSSRWVWLRRCVPLARSFWNQMKNYGLLNWQCHIAFARGVIDFLFDVRGERSLSNQGTIPGESFRVDGVPQQYLRNGTDV
jgi:GT2 family glycosyltransferase